MSANRCVCVCGISSVANTLLLFDDKNAKRQSAVLVSVNFCWWLQEKKYLSVGLIYFGRHCAGSIKTGDYKSAKFTRRTRSIIIGSSHRTMLVLFNNERRRARIGSSPYRNCLYNCTQSAVVLQSYGDVSRPNVRHRKPNHVKMESDIVLTVFLLLFELRRYKLYAVHGVKVTSFCLK